MKKSNLGVLLDISKRDGVVRSFCFGIHWDKERGVKSMSIYPNVALASLKPWNIFDQTHSKHVRCNIQAQECILGQFVNQPTPWQKTQKSVLNKKITVSRIFMEFA